MVESQKIENVKRELLGLLTDNFGDVTEKTFSTFYADDTLPIFLSSALTVLADLLGRPKAIGLVNKILAKYQMEEIPNA